jgi:hypothetical protein
MVTYAKAYILKRFNRDAAKLLDRLGEDVEAIVPKEIVIHPNADTEDQIHRAAEAISWRLSGCEAIWSLISNGLVFPASEQFRENGLSIGFTTNYQKSGGRSAGWKLDDLMIPVPSLITRSHLVDTAGHQPLSDPDLYLHDLDIPNMSEEVEAALREAVRCFKHGLYLGCLTLLGKAAEGAWIELGLTLANAIPAGASVDPARFVTILEDPQEGAGKKFKRTLDLYKEKKIFGDLYRESRYSFSDLRNVSIWADSVWESRHSIHYGVQRPGLPNSYEKVSALLIAAGAQRDVVYKIMEAAEKAS